MSNAVTAFSYAWMSVMMEPTTLLESPVGRLKKSRDIASPSYIPETGRFIRPRSARMHEIAADMCDLVHT